MAFTIREFHDFVKILEEKPEWRDELRRLVLTDELLKLPEMVRELTEAQRRTEKRLESLAAHVDNLTVRVDALTEKLENLTARVDALTERLENLTARVDSLTARVDSLTERLENLTARVDALAEAQRKTEERLESLAARVDSLGQSRTRKEVLYLSDAQNGQSRLLCNVQYRLSEWLHRKIPPFGCSLERSWLADKGSRYDSSDRVFSHENFLPRYTAPLIQQLKRNDILMSGNLKHTVGGCIDNRLSCGEVLLA